MASAGGGQDALKAAMQRRGIDVSALNMVGGGAAPSQQVAPMPDAQAAQAAMPQALGQPQPKEPDTESLIAAKALAGVLKNDGELKKGALQLRQMGSV